MRKVTIAVRQHPLKPNQMLRRNVFIRLSAVKVQGTVTSVPPLALIPNDLSLIFCRAEALNLASRPLQFHHG
jgi:hypothetical protein